MSKVQNFNQKWLLTRPWLRYNPVLLLMWCAAWRKHPQLKCSIPFVQCASNFKVFRLNEHGKFGTHCVYFALWKFGGCVISVTRTLPTEGARWDLGTVIMIRFPVLQRGAGGLVGGRGKT